MDGQELSDHMLFGSVVATTLVIVVTAQVSIYIASKMSNFRLLSRVISFSAFY